MEHTDWIGLATFVGAMAAAIVSIITALQGKRNEQRIVDVQETVNGNNDKNKAEAYATGVKDGTLTALAASNIRANDAGNKPINPPAG